MSKTRHLLLLAPIFVLFIQSSLAQGPAPAPLLSAPADVTISCADGLHDLGLTGRAVFPLEGTVTYEDTEMDWGTCGGGTVLRTFRAEDGEGKVQLAQQTISIREAGQRHVQMPGNYCSNGPRYLPDLSPDDLPDGHGLPIVHGDGCGVGMYHEDRVHLINGGKRVRIERKWTVCDPCTGLPCREHLQVIGSELLGGTDASTRSFIENSRSTTGRFELLQNRPNPFTHGTVIGFVLPEESDITLTVQQSDGRILKEWEGSYPAGYNEVDYEGDGASARGVLFYTLTTGGHRATMRMVHTK